MVLSLQTLEQNLEKVKIMTPSNGYYSNGTENGYYGNYSAYNYNYPGQGYDQYNSYHESSATLDMTNGYESDYDNVGPEVDVMPTEGLARALRSKEDIITQIEQTTGCMVGTAICMPSAPRVPVP